MTRLAIFDCDGTLVDSQATICRAMEQAFGELGREPPPRDDIRRIVGLSLFEGMTMLAPDADEDFRRAMTDSYKAAFGSLRANGLAEEPLYDGIAALLTRLDEDGWLLGVATGKSDRGLKACLDAHALTGLFATLQTADRHPSKPDPSMIAQAMDDAGASRQETVVIGDTSYDMMMARNAGVRAIGVAWGYHPPAELREAGAHDVAHTMDELTSCLEKL